MNFQPAKGVFFLVANTFPYTWISSRVTERREQLCSSSFCLRALQRSGYCRCNNLPPSSNKPTAEIHLPVSAGDQKESRSFCWLDLRADQSQITIFKLKLLWGSHECVVKPVLHFFHSTLSFTGCTGLLFKASVNRLVSYETICYQLWRASMLGRELNNAPKLWRWKNWHGHSQRDPLTSDLRISKIYLKMGPMSTPESALCRHAHFMPIPCSFSHVA